MNLNQADKMSNIIFTNKCNIKCPFCFASENNFSENRKTAKNFTISDSWKITNFISGNTFSFCGGEPTLNTNIIPTMESLLESGYNIHIFTNGIWPDNFYEFMVNMDSRYFNRISYLFNVLEPDFYSDTQSRRLHRTLDLINPIKAALGMTIYQSDFDYNYLIDLSDKYNIPNLRASIAAPNLSSGDYELENDYYAIAQKLHQFLLDAKKRNKVVYKDCNYIPPCFYENDQLLDMKYSLKRSWSFSCATSPIDIDSEGNTWRCFGLYSVLNTNIKDFRNEEELKRYFNRRMRILSNNMYAYAECRECPYWLKSCLGGCFVIRIKKAFSQKLDLCLFPIDDDTEILKCKPKVSENAVLRSDNGHVKIYSSDSYVNSDTNALAFMNEIDGEKSVENLIEKWHRNFDNYQEAKETVEKMCRNLFERDLIDINYDYGIEPEPRPKKISVE